MEHSERHSVPSRQLADCILIEGLKVNCVIGCLAWERMIEQPLEIDLQILLDLNPATQQDQLNLTVNYADLCDCVSTTLQQTQAQLLEYAAGQVLQALFAQFSLIQQIQITIRKPAIIANAHGIGVRLERSRDHFCPVISE